MNSNYILGIGLATGVLFMAMNKPELAIFSAIWSATLIALKGR